MNRLKGLGKTMQEIKKTLERFYNVTDIPLSLLDGGGRLIQAWPHTEEDVVLIPSSSAAIEAFRRGNRDALHPIIHFLEPGFLLGIMEVREDLYVLIGLVSPYRHSREVVLRTVIEAIHPLYLEVFCERILQQPLVTLEELKDLICLITNQLGTEVLPENILFVDNVSTRKLGASLLDQSIFRQREESAFHVPMDFEESLTRAVETGDRALLERTLFMPVPGRVGRMSQNELRQQKYAFVCLATLVSRAAIRGGLAVETAFNLSDLYCQRADLLTEIPLLQNLTFTMLMDLCGKVREAQKMPTVSPLIEKCLTYISVHLHEPVGLEDLSRHCNLCGRSLSLRFRKELGMSIPDYIHREKLREAEYMLRHTDYSLSAITMYLNYPSQSYFTQVFKKYRGQTPQQYRDRK